MVSILAYAVPIALAYNEQTVPPVEIQVVSGELVEHPKELNPEELVEYYSEMYGANPSLAKRIVQCESGWNRTIANPQPTASGYFQFLNSTWHSTMIRMGLPTSTDKHDPVISIQAGVWLLAEDGSRHWLESKPCWNR